MKYFATEFPHKAIPSEAAFVAQVISWLRGTNYSTVVNLADEADLDKSAPVIRSQTGEELRFRSLEEVDGKRAVGFRHDFPDSEGRLWRTEAVCRRGSGPNGQDLIRLRTQCIARIPGARIEAPRKPFLLKTILTDGWGGTDKYLTVSDQPIWLENDEDNLSLAKLITTGDASHYLPIIYLSANVRSGWALSEQQIGRFAYDLGGVAHVVVEPNRDFSFRLRDVTGGGNVYGGAVGIVLPSRGIVRRFFLGGQIIDARELESAPCSYVFALRSQMPAEGRDWTELQEQALRQHRERERNRLTAAETKELYDEEIATLRDRIAQLESQNDPTELIDDNNVEQAIDFISTSPRFGPELYPGELTDRIRIAAKMALDYSEKEGLDNRSKNILDHFARLPPTAGLTELLEDIKRATKNPARMADEVSDLLCRHGYARKKKNRHLVLEPNKNFDGIEAITVATTPSDPRGLTNMRKQIERALGLTKLN